MMSVNDIRNWLGPFVLVLTLTVCAWILGAPLILLPLDFGARASSAEIAVPFLLAQIATVYRFFSTDPPKKASDLQRLPAWVVKGPCIGVAVILVALFGMMAVAGVGQNGMVSPEKFKMVLTFCLSVLNVSTVLLVTRYFAAQRG